MMMMITDMYVLRIHIANDLKKLPAITMILMGMHPRTQPPIQSRHRIR